MEVFKEKDLDVLEKALVGFILPSQIVHDAPENLQMDVWHRDNLARHADKTVVLTEWELVNLPDPMIESLVEEFFDFLSFCLVNILRRSEFNMNSWCIRSWLYELTI